MVRYVPALGLALSGLLLVGVAANGDDKPDAKPAGTGRLPAKEYIEVDEKGVPNARFLLRVAEATPNIVEVRGINGWVAYASYDEAQKEYRGFFEWRRLGTGGAPGGKWADLYQIRMVKNADGELVMTGKSKENDFVIRAREHTAKPPAP